MDELELANRFDRQRPQLRAVAYRILGSLSEADDAVQEAWLRLRRTDAEQIDSLERWLTTVVARICLNMLRSRRTRGEQPLDGLRPEPIIDNPAVGTDPEHEALLADSVGIALQVVLDTLSPAERLAFVLHDMFAVPFDEIAAMVDRSPQATRQLASRARRRVREAAPPPDPDLTRQRAVVDAYFAAAREGDLEALVAVLDPDVVLRAHRRDGDPLELHGAARVARGAMSGPAFRAVRSPGAGQRRRRRGRVRRRAAVRGAGVHGRRRPRGGDRRVQRPRAGRQARHPRDHRLSNTPRRRRRPQRCRRRSPSVVSSTDARKRERPCLGPVTSRADRRDWPDRLHGYATDLPVGGRRMYSLWCVPITELLPPTVSPSPIKSSTVM